MSASKAELRRLGGLDSVLQMLSAKKGTANESAVLVIANCTQSSEEFCVELIQKAGDARITQLLEFLSSPSEVLCTSIARALANCSSVSPEATDVNIAQVRRSSVWQAVGAHPRRLGASLRLASPRLTPPYNVHMPPDAHRMWRHQSHAAAAGQKAVCWCVPGVHAVCP